MFKILILAGGLLLGQNSWACSCLPETLEDAYSKYQWVFRGKVTKLEKIRERIKVNLAVDTTWKGTPARSVSVWTNNSSAACGFGFQAKQEYVVFAWKNKKGEWEISSCSKTALTENAMDTLGWLDQHHLPAEEN